MILISLRLFIISIMWFFYGTRFFAPGMSTWGRCVWWQQRILFNILIKLHTTHMILMNKSSNNGRLVKFSEAARGKEKAPCWFRQIFIKILCFSGEISIKFNCSWKKNRSERNACAMCLTIYLSVNSHRAFIRTIIYYFPHNQTSTSTHVTVWRH